MGIIVIEGNNGAGKTTIIDILAQKYDLISKKSIPDWFRKYIDYARNCEPVLQKKLYLIGHEANYYNSLDEKNYIFDRYFYTTIIRLNYKMKISVNETVKEIISIGLIPKYIFIITADKNRLKERIKQRDNFDFNEEFYDYENEVYSKLKKIYDIISIIDNENLENTINEIESIVKERNLILKRSEL